MKLGDYPPNTAGSLSPPHGGVCIEAVPACVNGISNAVTPSRGGCGLKPVAQVVDRHRDVSPPHGGVWIETHRRRVSGLSELVTPSRGGVD